MFRLAELTCAMAGLSFLAGAAIGAEPASKAAPAAPTSVMADCPKFISTTTEPVLLRSRP